MMSNLPGVLVDWWWGIPGIDGPQPLGMAGLYKSDKSAYGFTGLVHSKWVGGGPPVDWGTFGGAGEALRLISISCSLPKKAFATDPFPSKAASQGDFTKATLGVPRRS